MNNLVIPKKTMSSVEIAELTGKRHDHIIRDVEKMLSDLELGLPKFGGTYLNSQNKVLKCYNLPKRESLILVSGYNVQMRAKIIDRWQELEVKAESKPQLIAGDRQDTILSLGLLADAFNVHGAERIKMFEKGLSVDYPALALALPSYNASKHEGSIGEVSERVSHSFTYHQKQHDFELRAAAFNKLAVSKGYVKAEVTSNGKPFKSVTEKGLKYGKNLIPKEASSQTQPHWYDDSIVDFYKIVVGE